MTTISDVLSGRAQWVAMEADCSEVLPMLPPKSVGCVLTDPPFSKHVHSLQRRLAVGAGAKNGSEDGRGHVVRAADLGFEHLTPELRRLCGVQFARVARRWVIVKSDEEGRHLWQSDLGRAGARHIRAGTWWKIGAQPQLSGRMPAVDREALQISHVRGESMRWNGGGMHASWYALPEHLTYRFPIATDRNGSGDRVHTTQTPLNLWLQVVEDFTDPDEIVLDPFMGSGSLGIACVRRGRRYIGMDNGCDAPACRTCARPSFLRRSLLLEHDGKPWAAWAREGMEAEERGLSRGAARAGQLGLFGG